MTVQELLSDESKWCRYAMANDKDGRKCSSQDKFATRWCLHGAMLKAYTAGSLSEGAVDRLLEEVKSFGFDSIHTFNDHPCTSFKDIREAITNANI